MNEFKLSPELEILIRAIRFVIDVHPDENESPIPKFDTRRLMRLAAQHRLRPILAEYDKQYNILDPQTRTHLESIRSRQIQRNLKMVHVLHQVIKKLESIGVDVLPMKGNLFIHVLYGNQQLRETGDIDILVPRYQLKDAVLALEELGFELNVGYKIVPREYRDGLLKMMIDSPHQSELKLDDGTFHIDLHWKLAQPYYGLQTREDEIFQQAESTTMHNREIKVPCTLDIFWMMMVHHGGKEHWKNLRHLVDFHFMLKMLKSDGMDINSPKINQTAGQIGVQTTLNDGIWLYNRFLTPVDKNLAVIQVQNFDLSLHDERLAETMVQMPELNGGGVDLLNKNRSKPPHISRLIQMWEGLTQGTARLQLYFNYFIRFPRRDRNFSIPTLFWIDMQMRIENGRIQLYPNEFGITQIIRKAIYLVVKIIRGKN